MNCNGISNLLLGACFLCISPTVLLCPLIQSNCSLLSCASRCLCWYFGDHHMSIIYFVVNLNIDGSFSCSWQFWWMVGCLRWRNNSREALFLATEAKRFYKFATSMLSKLFIFNTTLSNLHGSYCRYVVEDLVAACW
jgi:hypothetical protein